MSKPVRKRVKDVLMDLDYSEEHLYVIVDENEKTSTIEYKVSDELKAVIEMLVEFGIYADAGEFFRDSLAHYLRWLHDDGFVKSH
ncbi:MAG: hypothetical protein QMD10_10240 [Desulfitobacteriaceae bacterium]|nr:hypothetical protein [Desulfitobacteriaceae bacterium]